MAVHIERTEGLVRMSLEELHREVEKKEGVITIRLSAEALRRPGAVFRIHSASRHEPPAADDKLQ